MTSLIGQPKSFASLSSTLLARKGHARPAMRSQGYAGFGGAGFGAAPDAGDDLGWNDMGHATPAEPVASPVPPVLRQREVLREELSGPVAVEAPPPGSTHRFDRDRACSRRSCSRWQQGQGGVYAPARFRASLAAAAGERACQSLGTADRLSGARCLSGNGA